jgi:hypothetical protein
MEVPVTGTQEDPGWMRSTRRLADALIRFADEWHREASAEPGRNCTDCPLCRGMTAVRQAGPELTEHLTGAVEEFLTAYRHAGERPGTASRAGHAGTPDPGDAHVPAATDRHVERIDITD